MGNEAFFLGTVIIWGRARVKLSFLPFILWRMVYRGILRSMWAELSIMVW